MGCVFTPGPEKAKERKSYRNPQKKMNREGHLTGVVTFRLGWAGKKGVREGNESSHFTL